MKSVNIVWVALALMAALLASCGGGGGPATPPDSFERMTAVAYGTNGTPLSNLQVRVEGQDTGISTDANGAFTLQRGQFPRGVNTENEISLGTNGVVVGSRSVVPLDNQNLVIRFQPSVGGEGTGSLGGSVTDENSGAGLNNVEVTIFSEAGGVQTTHTSGGVYRFDDVSSGTWNIVANVEDYYPGMAMVRVAEGDTSIRNIELTRKGQVGSGDGIMVSGRIVDSKSGAGVGGATVSMMVDTGYFGIPEPIGFEDDFKWDEVDDSPNVGQTEPGFAGGGADGRDISLSLAPDDYWRYEPQYQELTTDADGYFEFPDSVAGYSAWFSVYKEGYLNGNLSREIYGMTENLEVEIAIQPIVMTAISGKVVDGEGQPLKGAYVEYVFGGGFGYDIAVPGAVDLDMVFEDGIEIFNEFGAPAPPQSRGEDMNTGGSDDFAFPTAPAADFAEESTNSDGSGSSGSEFDNNTMQRFLWERRNGRSSSMVADAFIGYYSTYADENGEFSFDEVPAGPYYVFASAYRHVAYSADVTVEENEAANEVVITLPEIPVGSVQGKVTDEDGNPLPDVLVNATQPNVDPFTYTDASGNFVIDNVPVGEWLVSGYRNGYLTQGISVEIRDGQASNVSLVLETYEAPDVVTGNFSGTVFDGYDDSTIAGADMVFTPWEESLGGAYHRHVVSDGSGRYSTTLAEAEYNLLIQAGGYEDIFIRIWPESYNREMDFWMWPIGAPGGGGGGTPIGIEPFFDDVPPAPGDPGSPENPIGL
ncbi:carboxypeptidase regulatory-like domain-containing protein [bacterium]|nr:carboxypeptidase regulatory-like domain-containing protein [bacterium]